MSYPEGEEVDVGMTEAAERLRLPLTVVFWCEQPQFSVRNPDGNSQEAAQKLENLMDEIIRSLAEQYDDEWNCTDLSEDLVKAGYEISGSMPINDDVYWRYDVHDVDLDEDEDE
jgi:hypothetical protein